MQKQKTGFLKHANFALPYRRYGHGEEILLAFHGFGRSAEDFSVFESTLGNVYTIIAVDFFFHGVNEEKLDDPVENFSTSVMSMMIEKFLWEEKKVNFSIMGYSFGGKIVLGLIHKLPHRLNEVFLLAPDGFTADYGRRLFTHTLMGKYIGKLALNYPQTFISTLDFASKIKLLAPHQLEFFKRHLESRNKRLRVYRTWQTVKEYKLHLNLAHHYLNTKAIRFELFFGKHDEIIKPDVADKFRKMLKNKSGFHLLDCGHRLLNKSEEIGRIILLGHRKSESKK